GATLQKPPEWDQPSNLNQSTSKRWDILSFIPKVEHRDHPKPGDVTIRSAVHDINLPTPVNSPRLQRHVGRMEMIRGPEDTPGYWAVSGAKLSVHNAKIDLLVKYSLLTFVIQSEIKTS
ncbi:MACPF domain-containing protein, partial [Trifolium medium]|nr:MACPF domain-containing protein [Trifolium medium]